MDYKKIFVRQETRRKILKMLRFVPDKQMLQIQYYIKTGRKLNLRHPKRFTEKLQWYKINYRNPLMQKCVNKYSVRDYIEEKGLGSLLVELYAHYDRIEDVEWDSLPDQFVIKTQHGGGGLSVITCPNKSELDINEVVSKLSFNQKTVEGRLGGREWAYWGIPTGIVIEELLINKENPRAGVNDYKIFCYKGNPKYIVVAVDRYIGHKRNFYNINWKNLPVTSDCQAIDRKIEKPENFEEMLNIASKLSEDFPFVRVDLYNISGKIYFGELTFYPWSGYVQFTPDKADYIFGKDFELITYKDSKR